MCFALKRHNKWCAPNASTVVTMQAARQMVRTERVHSRHDASGTTNGAHRTRPQSSRCKRHDKWCAPNASTVVTMQAARQMVHTERVHSRHDASGTTNGAHRTRPQSSRCKRHDKWCAPNASTVVTHLHR